MPRRTREAKLETRSARLRLPVAKKPVFVKIGRGVGLGYRRNMTSGTWVIRVTRGGKDWTKAIGTADDFDNADGTTVLDFWQAQDWARAAASEGRARAVRAAGLDPNEVTIYALRHSNIVRQLLAGVPVRVVAVNHDTSVVMIERTYSRYIGDHADALARKALLDLGAPAAGNVVPLATAR